MLNPFTIAGSVWSPVALPANRSVQSTPSGVLDGSSVQVTWSASTSVTVAIVRISDGTVTAVGSGASGSVQVTPPAGASVWRVTAGATDVESARVAMSAVVPYAPADIDAIITAIEQNRTFLPNLGPFKGAGPGEFFYWRTAKLNAITGSAGGKILCVGDSTTAGIGAQGNNNQGSPSAYPPQLAVILNSLGIPAARGLGVPPPNHGTVTDTRWSAGTGWALPTSGFAWGNKASYEWSGSTVGNLTFTDPVEADTYDVYFLTNTGTLGNFTATATGGSGVVATGIAGTAGIGKITCTAAAAGTGNVVTITPANNGPIYVIGVEPSLSTKKQVRVGNAGVGATTTSDWVSSGSNAVWDAQAAIKAYAPDLTIISLGINDADISASPNTVTANIATLIATAQVSGDVLLLPPFPVESTALAVYVTYVPQYDSAIAGMGYPYLDVVSRWVSGDNMKTYAWRWDGDGAGLHLSNLGYGDLANALAQFLVAL